MRIIDHNTRELREEWVNSSLKRIDGWPTSDGTGTIEGREVKKVESEKDADIVILFQVGPGNTFPETEMYYFKYI